MSDAFSAAGSLVHTPSGPRKSGRPLSVLMPARSGRRPARVGQPAADLLKALPAQAGYLPLDDHLKDTETAWTSPDLFRVEEPRHAENLPTFPIATLTVKTWPDPVINTVGHDVRSPYVERFSLGLLGPSATWLLRRLVGGLDEHPEGYPLDLALTATELGLGTRSGPHSPFFRSIDRCCRFGPPNRWVTAAATTCGELHRSHRVQLTRLPRGAAGGAHRLGRGPGYEPAGRRLPRASTRGLALSFPRAGRGRRGHRPGSSTSGASTRRWPTRPWRGPSTAAGHPPRSPRAAPARRRRLETSKGPFGQARAWPQPL